MIYFAQLAYCIVYTSTTLAGSKEIRRTVTSGCCVLPSGATVAKLNSNMGSSGDAALALWEGWGKWNLLKIMKGS